jgi:sigma-B regulation protein RsbU (phosphoserine phosphatase)
MSGSARVLVVDDEPDLEQLIRQKYRRQIRDGQISFAFAGDGVEALERLDEEEGICLVLSDINMPRMDGLSLLTHISKLERPIKVIMVSAYSDMANIRKAMNRGAFDFLTKPIHFDDLTATIEKTHREIELYRAGVEAQQRLTTLRRELEIARQIQLSMLPSATPAFPNQPQFELHATMTPAQEVGGDLYDCFLLDETHVGFAIGDVSGKGVAAALFMAVTVATLRATALRGLGAAACVREVNRVLQPASMPHMFVSLVYGVLDRETGEVTLCNAGHNKPYVLRSGGALERIDAGRGVGVCLLRDYAYPEATLTLHPGDTLVLYTDGVTEAIDPQRDRFEEARLEACLRAALPTAPAAIVGSVLGAVDRFASGTPPADDVTLLVLRYTGTASNEEAPLPLRAQTTAEPEPALAPR